MAKVKSDPVTSALTAQEPTAFKDDDTADVWLSYTKQRFEEVSRRIDDFRSWGRQMVGWIGVLIALEANLFPRMSEKLHSLSGPWRIITILAIGAVTAGQLLLWCRAARTGFVASNILSPENPSLLAAHLIEVDAQRAREILAAYFAKSYGTYDDAAERIAKQLKSITTFLIALVWIFAIITASLFWFTKT